MLKAIETRYKGYRFRSRLEARWAVFFDTLGVPYEYEKEGYILEGKPYLPDFWLSRQQCWVEVKGQEPNWEELHKADLLCIASERWVDVLIGTPGEHHIYAFRHYHAIPSRSGFTMALCDNCSALCFGHWKPKEKLFFAHCYACGGGVYREKKLTHHPRLLAAYQTARSARFEHGEHP